MDQISTPRAKAKAGALPASDRDTSSRILDGAAMLFSEHGYAHGSIRNIASVIGIQGPSFYHHFASKEEMTAKLLRDAAAFACGEIAKVNPADFPGDPQALLEAAVEAHMRAYFDPGRALAALVRIYRQLPPELFLVARRGLRPLRDRWAEIVLSVTSKPSLTRTEAQAVSLMLFGAMNSMADWQERPGFAMPLPALRKLFAKIIFKGLST
jgi:AcrR family transcriptional regulator